MKRRFIIAYCALVLLATLIVPWRVNLGEDMSISKGFSFIFSPPAPMATIDYGVVFLELLAISAIAVIVYIMVIKTTKS